MGENENENKGKWFGWIKNIIAAVVGAVISCLATLGIIGPSDADIAKEKMNSWLDKSEVVYVQVTTVQETLAEVKALLADKKYLEALAKLETITDNAKETIAAVKELKEEIQEAIKAVKEHADEIKDNVQDKVDEIKDAVQDVKDAVGDKPAEGGSN